MPGNLQPLVDNQKIVKSDGTPTDYFIRWAQQRQIDISAGITAAEAQALIDAWAAARDVVAGFGLSGGGFLSSDITINLDAVLNDLNDVTISLPLNGDALIYDSGTGQWKNGVAVPGTNPIYAPLTTGEVYAGQPRLVYDTYGQCVLVEVA